MAGLDRETLRPMPGWPHVEQSIGVILSTAYGERVMREWVGSLVPRMLGENLTGPTLLRFCQAIAIAIDLFEPRFRVRSFKAAASPEQGRAGRIALRIEGDYRPRGHLGDPTPEGRRGLTLAF